MSLAARWPPSHLDSVKAGTTVIFPPAVVAASPAGLTCLAQAPRGWLGSSRTSAAGLGNWGPPTTWPPCTDTSTCVVGLRGTHDVLLKAWVRRHLACSTEQ